MLSLVDITLNPARYFGELCTLPSLQRGSAVERNLSGLFIHIPYSM